MQGQIEGLPDWEEPQCPQVLGMRHLVARFCCHASVCPQSSPEDSLCRFSSLLALQPHSYRGPGCPAERHWEANCEGQMKE